MQCLGYTTDRIVQWFLVGIVVVVVQLVNTVIGVLQNLFKFKLW